MTAEVLNFTVDELREWHDKLIAAAGLTRSELEEREEALSLSLEERDILATLRGIEFLLQDQP